MGTGKRDLEQGGPAGHATDLRQELLAGLGLPELAPVGQLRALTRVAAALCGVSTAVVNLLDGRVQHQVGEVGFSGAASPQLDSMCAVALAQPRLRYLPDAAAEPAFAGNPWVDGRLARVRFYASAPMVLPDGQALGSLCVFSGEAATLTPAQREALQDLADQAVLLLLQAHDHRAAQQQASLLRLVAEGSADVLSRHAPDGTVLYVSPSVQGVLGHDPAACVGVAALAVVHRQDRPALRTATSAVLRGQQGTATTTVRCRHRDGTWRWLEVHLAPIRDVGGRVLELHSVGRDVTDRVVARRDLARAEDEAQSRAAMLGAVLDTIDVGVVACDADGRLLLFNRAARDMHGLAEEPGLDSSFWADRYGLYAEDGTTALGADEVPLLRALRQGSLADQVMVVVPGGRPPLTVRCDGRALRDSSGALLGAVVAMKDITDSRARAAELVQARDEALAGARAKTAFVTAASHQIRTPLNGILGSLQLLSMLRLTDEQAKYVQVAHRSGEGLLKLLNDVLDLSRAEATGADLTQEPFDPYEVAGAVVAALEAVAVGKGLRLTLHGAADGPRVTGDPVRLRQVLIDLAGRAVTSSGAGAVAVSVDAEPTGNHRVRLRVSVGTTGPAPGPAGQVQQGLVRTRSTVEQLGGTLVVVTGADGSSTTTVLVELPRFVEQVHTAVAAPSGTATGQQGRGLTVLVADDSDINLMVAEAMLVSQGAEVVTVVDGDRAVAAVVERDFDLVLLDQQMPRMSGTAAARAIRALSGRPARTRLVALTATATAADRERFQQAGLDDVLGKPVRLNDLQRVLAEARWRPPLKPAALCADTPGVTSPTSSLGTPAPRSSEASA